MDLGPAEIHLAETYSIWPRLNQFGLKLNQFGSKLIQFGQNLVKLDQTLVNFGRKLNQFGPNLQIDSVKVRPKLQVD